MASVKTFGDSNNLAIVLLHPFPFSAELWEQVAIELAGNNYYVVTPDFRGCGNNELGSEKPNLDTLADDVFEVIQDLKIINPIIGGISLGGYVAMAMARLNPQSIRGLILLDTKASADSDLAKENRLKVADQMRQLKEVASFAAQMLPGVIGEFTKNNRPKVLNQVQVWMAAANPETIAWLQVAMADRKDSFSTLENFNKPTLLIRGEQDQISSDDDFMKMVKKLKQVTYIQISNAGHLPPVEDPSSTSQAIRNWLSETTFTN